jgi:hypothetical protein
MFLSEYDCNILSIYFIFKVSHNKIMPNDPQYLQIMKIALRVLDKLPLSKHKIYLAGILALLSITQGKSEDKILSTLLT